MSRKEDHLRLAVQKLTEAIWNLDQMAPLRPEIKEEYERIRKARENLMKQMQKGRAGFSAS